ncbi:hypothetical protein BJK05_07280 [Pectobacterium polaris]|nr:hypothetical protein BJK05_07280 [Pectobacterium polaris]
MWHYHWDSRNQLRVVDTPAGERWFYRYDPFGRRIGKRCDQTHEDIRYLWDGDQIAEVRHHRVNQLISRRHWVHNGWELLVQQRQAVDGNWETDFVTSGHNGEPQAAFNPQGELRWQAPRTNLWGQRYTDNTESLDPGLGFAGQYRDAESSLCYNRFRYYDPSSGCYISPDPISILGGDNNYGYVHNPVDWIDPFGLAGCSTTLGKNMMQGMGLPRSSKWSGYQAHHVIPKELANHPALKKINYYIDNANNGIFLRKVDDGVSAMARHQGNHHGYTDAIRGALDRIDLNQSVSSISKQVTQI